MRAGARHFSVQDPAPPGRAANALGARVPPSLRENFSPMTVTAEQALQIASAHRQAERLEEAVTWYRHALALDPARADGHGDLGGALLDLGRFDESIASSQRAVALNPALMEAHNNLGNAFSQTQRWAEATACYRRALALDPNRAEVYNNLGASLQERRCWDEAGAAFDRAIALLPDFAEAHTGKGAVLFQKGEFARALASYNEASAHQPDFAAAHWKRGLLLLLLGRYEEGWNEMEWRWASGGPAIGGGPPLRRWKGAPAVGQTILVHPEQGYGDTLHLLRYAPLVRAHAGARHVILNVPHSLGRLLRSSGEWNAEVVARKSADEGPLLPFHQHVPLTSLPLALRRFEPLPMMQPYLRADPQLCDAWQARLGPVEGLRVGLAWAGNPQYVDDADRSIAFARLEPLLNTPGVRFYSLQITPRPAPDPRVTDLTPDITDFADTAALMSGLDLVISVDTAIAHLAGALGRPVWTLIRSVPDWRWGLGREDTPWYPTMRLFRQRVAGDWDELIGRVAAELRVCHEKRPPLLSH